jgi:hypothetical protein
MTGPGGLDPRRMPTVAEIKAFVLSHQPFFWTVGAASVGLFLVSCLVIPTLIVRMGADYFCEDRDETRTMEATHPGWRFLGLLTKNLVGATLLIAGIAMLVLPGQGFLTILVGLVMMDFPGKRALELRLLRVPGITRAINRLRARFNRPPLRLPPQ